MGCSGSAIADRENFSTFVPRIRSLHIVICQRCIGTLKSGKFSYISKFHILISYKLTIYIVMCFYQGTN